VTNAVWISISNPVEFFQNPVQFGSGSEVQNPVGSQSGNLIMFNTGVHVILNIKRMRKEFGQQNVAKEKLSVTYGPTFQ